MNNYFLYSLEKDYYTNNKSKEVQNDITFHELWYVQILFITTANWQTFNKDYKIHRMSVSKACECAPLESCMHNIKKWEDSVK